MTRDIEEFLKLAAQRRKKSQGQGGQTQQPAQQQQPAQHQRQPVQQQRKPPRPVQQEPIYIAAEVVEEPKKIEPVRPTVKPRVDTSAIRQRVTQLGEGVESKKKVFQEHVSEVFDHDPLGRLAKVETVTKRKPQKSKIAKDAASAGSLAKMLADATSVRQAIVLSEVLRRPEERWD